MRPLVLIYHSVPRRTNVGAINAQSFEEHMRLLKRKCTFIRPEEYYSASGSLRCPAVLLTFDDGLRNNAEVVAPILRRLDTPAVFFVSSRHCIQGQQLWFTYLNMLRCYYPGTSVTLNGSSICLAGAQRKKGIDELALRLLALEPHPEAAYAAIASQLPRLEEFVPTSILADECYGMTPEQVHELGNDPLFTVGGHTVDHPYLTRCDSQEVSRQMATNKNWLEHVTGRKCDLFAYPLGDFDTDVLEQCRQLEFQQAFATEWGGIPDPHFAIRRVGIYRTELALLCVKVWHGHWLPLRLIHTARSFAQVLGAYATKCS